MLDEIQDNIEAQLKVSKMFGKFIHEVSLKDIDTIHNYKEQLCKHFSNYCTKDDASIRENAAFNFSCLFDLFAVYADNAVDAINFGQLLRGLTKESEELETKTLIAGQYHEILIILEQKDLDIYEYIQPLINILKSS
tara:strand:- start:312 stop:722 length:411 start_codon:yes stop_codon:yes gene_type:complete